MVVLEIGACDSRRLSSRIRHAGSQQPLDGGTDVLFLLQDTRVFKLFGDSPPVPLYGGRINQEACKRERPVRDTSGTHPQKGAQIKHRRLNVIVGGM